MPGGEAFSLFGLVEVGLWQEIITGPITVTPAV